MRREWIVVFVFVLAIAIGGYFVLRAASGGGGGTPVERLVTMRDNRYVLDGWRHQGPGGFTLDSTTGALKSYGGMGLLWYAAKEYGDFTLELDFRCADSATNSGVFLRVPGEPTSDEYIYHSFEIQIDDAAAEPIHQTGAVYDAEAPSDSASRAPGEWNHFVITFRGSRITVVLNDKRVIDWDAEPRGKVRDFAPRGYVGLQNHDDRSPVEFRNVVVRALP